MLNSRTKDKIYAFLSFLTIVLVIGSFALAVNFLVRINKYIFSINEKTVKEKTTIVDKAGFESVKEKLKFKEGGAVENIQTKKNSEIEKEVLGDDAQESPVNDIPAVGPSVD